MYPQLKRFSQRYKYNCFYLLFLFAVSLFSFWRELLFTFTKDDWSIFWNSVNVGHINYVYWLHPATQVEVFLFARLIGYIPFLWMFFGLLVRVGIAYCVYVLVTNLTNSKRAGYLSGIFYATTYASLEAVGFVSAHVAAIATFFVCLSLYLFVRYIKGEKSAKVPFFILFFIALISDPGRVFLTVGIFPILYIVVKQKFPHVIRKYWKVLVVMGAILFCGLFVMFQTVLRDALLHTFLNNVIHNPWYLIKKLHVIANYFASVGNLMLGWIINVPQDEQNTAVYSKLSSRIGMLLCVATLILFYFSTKLKKKKLQLVAFFTLWIFFFYFPNWLFEPRAPMSGAHRYQSLAGVGFVSLVAYSLSCIRKEWVIVALSLIFITFNIFTANRILTYQATFRNNDILNRIWDQVDREVPKENKKYVFVFTGQQPILSQSIELGGVYLYAIKRHISKQQQLPLLTHETPFIVSLLCTQKTYSLSMIYAWDVGKNGYLVNRSLDERMFIKNEAVKKGCYL